MTLGQKFKQERIKHKLTVDKVAHLLGCSENWIYIIERGPKTPSMSLIVSFCEKTGVSFKNNFLEYFI